MRPHFDYYIGALDRWPFHVGVNLALKSAAPVSGLEWRAHVRIDLNHPTADGLATNGEEAELYEVEDKILSHLKREDYCFVSQVTHRNRRTMVIYLREKPEENSKLMTGLESILNHKTAIIDCVHDPEWSEYKEVLYPQPNFEHQINDKKRLKEMERSGDDCSRLHAIDVSFHAPTPQAAEKLAAELKLVGFGVKSVLRAGGSESQGWRVIAEVESPLALSILDDFRETWFDTARRAGCRFDGWNAEIVPVEADGRPTAKRAPRGKQARALSRRPGAKKKVAKKASAKGPKAAPKRTAVARRKAEKSTRADLRKRAKPRKKK